MPNTLKVLFLNIWAGRQEAELIDFISSQLNPFDIMCLTEVSHLKGALPKTYVHLDKQSRPALLDAHNLLSNKFYRFYDHRFNAFGEEPWTCLETGDMYDKVLFGSSLFHLRHGAFTVIQGGAEQINTGHANGKPRVLQWICVNMAGTRYLIAHLHGVWIRDNTKGDSPERDTQSRMVRIELVRLMAKCGAKKLVFGGDFNLDLETNALRRLEGWGSDGMQLKNLVRENGITSTRTPLYRKHGTGETLHADYVLTTPNVDVRSFIVDNTALVSDHAPLMVSFS